METRINEVLAENINPVLAQHRGSCSLDRVEDGVAYIKLAGGCKGCPGRQATLLNGIKPYLQQNVEGLTDVKLAE